MLSSQVVHGLGSGQVRSMMLEIASMWNGAKSARSFPLAFTLACDFAEVTGRYNVRSALSANQSAALQHILSPALSCLPVCCRGCVSDSTSHDHKCTCCVHTSIHIVSLAIQQPLTLRRCLQTPELTDVLSSQASSYTSLNSIPRDVRQVIHGEARYLGS